jgi:endonuclease YncB( thermonuclease family)
MIWNPVGMLNTYVGISIPHPERKDMGNDKSSTWERGEKAQAWLAHFQNNVYTTIRLLVSYRG